LKSYTRAVLPAAFLPCSLAGTSARISAKVCRDRGNVDPANTLDAQRPIAECSVDAGLPQIRRLEDV
jgi:hypothetical protein